MRTVHWSWEPVNEAVSGSSGDLAKLFKNEVVREPSLLRVGSPPPDATLMAREVIQNSWDAARELAEDNPDFEMRFEFRSLVGDEKQQLVRALDLAALAERASSLAPGEDLPARRQRLGLPQHCSLDDLADSSVPLRVLRIHERATTGMYGPWKGDHSKMYLALVSQGMTEKAAGAGGSYGYGKAGLIRGSAIRSIVAYTCFLEREDDLGITRRLLGMTYWGRHARGDTSFNGFARFGTESGSEHIVPFENDDADRVAESLGFELRSAADGAEDPSDLGTSYLVIEPTFGPDDLNVAICRNWWPALINHRFSIEIHTDDPEPRTIHPQPKKIEVLRAFIEGYEWATVPRDNDVDGKRRFESQNVAIADGGALKLGTLGLISDKAGWSFPTQANAGDEDDETVRHHSLVALVRSPLMVVEYFDAGRTAPFVRGTFVAHSDVDDLLRQTEPKAHDCWQSAQGIDGVPPRATDAARKTAEWIKRNVNAFRKTLKPNPPDPGTLRLPELERLFREMLRGGGSAFPQPPPGQPEHSLRVVGGGLEATASNHLVYAGTLEVGLTPRGEELAGDGSLASEVLVRYQYLEDGVRKGEVGFDTLEFDGSPAPPPDSDGWRPAVVDGESALTITFRTLPYDPDSTCALVAEVRVWPGAVANLRAGDQQ